jgi:hypothetical protein
MIDRKNEIAECFFVAAANRLADRHLIPGPFLLSTGAGSVIEQAIKTYHSLRMRTVILAHQSSNKLKDQTYHII